MSFLTCQKTLVTHVAPQDDREEQTGDRKTVADLLHEGAGGSERRLRDVLAGVPVDNRADDDVHAGNEDLVDDHGAVVETGVAHLGDDAEAGGQREVV
jgi:hypothetical protein